MMESLNEWFKPLDPENVKKQKEDMIAEEPLEDEETDCFFKDSEEIRAEPELGGLGPGLTGEHTIYSFVVVRNDKRWVLKKRYSQLHIFDRMLMQTIKEAGGDESVLPEFPPKKLFGKMSPSLVKERAALLENYLKEIARDKDLVQEPLVRMFLKLPMNQREVEALNQEHAKAADPGLLTGYGQYKSLYQRTREEKKAGIHHTQKREMFAGPPTLAGASEVGAAFAGSSVHDAKAEKKWVFRIPILADFGGQTVKDVFGGEVKGLHSTYGNKVKEQVEKASKDGKTQADEQIVNPH
mmetsp:Transcript_42514/g.66591  ORF Transcript_42514/g.66591 Transcript_42514/m.66591 type:complete len:296 (-) Transcript_42514:1430-2317(-)|eukprot:CAMPEP_0184290274 /NCGR_PEP_ID=MMETSP1049-20130417/2588_1 /TAXON_ID=77928 /ORGANISM="Proteomonas sulcata, Strain CCMP704" /LENGTH=295 /DNA_ID=CAMNT_0026597401 /DNA_START=180 /DNA_END=1067 /DNA_ORIENTATION=+